MSYIGNTQQNQNYVPQVDFFSGNGSTTTFTLSRPVASVAQVQVVVNNVPQKPGDAYTVLNSTITFTGAPSSGTNNIYVYYTSPNTQVIQPSNGTVGANQVDSAYALWNKSGNDVNYTAGNVGIGSSSTLPSDIGPTVRLGERLILMSQAGNSAYYTDNLYYNSGWKYAANGYGTTVRMVDGQFIVYNAPSNSSGAGTAATTTERMRIDSSGNLLVGATSAYLGCKMLVAQSSGNVSWLHSTDASMTGEVLAIRANRNTTNNTFYAIRYYNDGAGNWKFQVADSGNVTNTNNSYGAISDVKLKENIVDASPKLEDLCNVKVRNFNFIGDSQKQIGVIAQELETVFPGMVDESPDKDEDGNSLGTSTKQVKYSVFVPMLIKAIQELSTKNDALEARIIALEAK